MKRLSSTIMFWIRQLWRPTEFTVCYVYALGVGCDIATKYKYRRVEQAQAKLVELADMSAEQLAMESISPCPMMFRIIHATSGHPLTRLLNLTGRKRIYNIFGYRV